MERVEHHDRRTAYRLVEGDGSGPTTLYVHGSGGSHHVWGHQYAPGGPAHPACAIDLSGHGESDDLPGGRGDIEDGASPHEILDAYARDITAVADATGADVLVGNSLGGAVVLRTVIGEFFDPAGIVLAGTGARLPVDEKLRDLLANDFEASMDVLHGTDVLFHDVDDRAIERSRATMRAAGQAVLRRDFEACHHFDVADRLDRIDVPALAIVGAHDRLTPPEYHRTLAAKIPDCRYEEIDGAAHLAMLDRPEAFNDALVGFFEAEL